MLADPNLVWKSAIAHLAVKRGPAKTGSFEDGPHPQDSFRLWHRDIPRPESILLYSGDEVNDARLASANRAGDLCRTAAHYSKRQHTDGELRKRGKEILFLEISVEPATRFSRTTDCG
jgi:hypothetical protein